MTSATRRTGQGNRGSGARRTRLLLTVLGTTALAGTVPAQQAAADETRTGHQLTLVSIGQIDDPAEDVLEHAVILKNAQLLPTTHNHYH
ncbi:hypothetical protein ACIQ9E_22655 [Streptomyces sp. NPDC094448]|uniref:hypothetical protein n=1 Tax=Streptomyces sp. NPDC094448 TaxID=3366063 RepID=UPI00380D443A